MAVSEKIRIFARNSIHSIPSIHLYHTFQLLPYRSFHTAPSMPSPITPSAQLPHASLHPKY
ncbi:hypothetical protein NND19_03280 [Prevotella copri]|nr:hypothetical protein [Segatella copri]